jgi:hypothetical protein
VTAPHDHGYMMTARKRRVRCSRCTHFQAVKCVRLDSCLRPTYQRLCVSCQKTLGFRPVNWERTYGMPRSVGGLPVRAGGGGDR